MTQVAAAGSLAISLRPAREADLGRILELERDGFERPWSAASWLEEVRSHHVFLGDTGDPARAVAVAALSLVADSAELLSITVCSELRGRGVGREVLGQLLAWAQAEGATEIFLEVSVGNTAAIRLYERAGFVRIDCRKDYYGPADDAWIYRCTLGRPRATN